MHAILRTLGLFLVFSILGGHAIQSIGQAQVSEDRVQETLEKQGFLPVAPIYPQDAAAAGITGWAEIEFTVTKEGKTANLRIVESHPVGVFEEASLQAVRKFRYRPKLVNGDAVEIEGERQKITFTQE